MSQMEPIRPEIDPPIPSPPPDQGDAGGMTRRSFYGWAAALSALIAPPVYALIRRVTRPTLKVAVDGPFPADRPVPIQAEENPFVSPAQLEVISLGPNTALVDVRFGFRGPERKSRRIELKFTARGPDDRIVARETHVCTDQRVFAREHSGEPIGHRAAWFDPTNTEKFPVPADSLGEIRRIELQFREV